MSFSCFADLLIVENSRFQRSKVRAYRLRHVVVAGGLRFCVREGRRVNKSGSQICFASGVHLLLHIRLQKYMRFSTVLPEPIRRKLSIYQLTPAVSDRCTFEIFIFWLLDPVQTPEPLTFIITLFALKISAVQRYFNARQCRKVNGCQTPDISMLLSAPL